MLSVQIRRLNGKFEDVVVGKIIWDGKRVIAEPEGDDTLDSIISLPITPPGSEKLYAKKNGARFVEGLPWQYKSAYLRAESPKHGEVKEVYDPHEPRDKQGRWAKGHGPHSDQLDQMTLREPFNLMHRLVHADHLEDEGNPEGAEHLRLRVRHLNAISDYVGQAVRNSWFSEEDRDARSNSTHTYVHTTGMCHIGGETFDDGTATTNSNFEYETSLGIPKDGDPAELRFNVANPNLHHYHQYGPRSVFGGEETPKPWHQAWASACVKGFQQADSEGVGSITYETYERIEDLDRQVDWLFVLQKAADLSGYHVSNVTSEFVPMIDRDKYTLHFSKKEGSGYVLEVPESIEQTSNGTQLLEFNKSGIFVDKLGHKYRLENGVHVPLGPDGEESNGQSAGAGGGGDSGGWDRLQPERQGGSTGGTVRPDGEKPVGGSQPTERPGPSVFTVREEHTKQGDPKLVPEALRQYLNEAQQHGVSLAISAMEKHGGFLNSDGTGIGKTRQQLAVAKYFADKGFASVIISPSEVIKPDWNEGVAFGSFANDSEKMGIPLLLADGTRSLERGTVHLSTYDKLEQLKEHINKDVVLILDEGHALKNPDSARAKNAAAMMDQAHSVMYATATPGDKPLHMSYLVRANVFGNIGKMNTYRKLGLIRANYRNPSGKMKQGLVVDPKVGNVEAARRISGLFDQMTKDGLMIRRELSMDNVDVSLDRIELPPEQIQEIKRIFDEKKEAAGQFGGVGIALLATRLYQEPFKIPHTVKAVQEELANKRQAVVFLGRINAMADEPDTSQGTAQDLKKALIAAGIKESYIGDLHGGVSPSERRLAVNKFQSGKHKILISTVQSGATGINLDDTVGNKPRSVIMMTPPFTAGEVSQMMGRVNRLNTKSDVRVRGILSNTMIDDWNAGILENKFRTLGAAVGGNSARGSVTIGKDMESEWTKPFNWGDSLLPKKPFESVKHSMAGSMKVAQHKSWLRKILDLLAAKYSDNPGWLLLEAFNSNEARDRKGRWTGQKTAVIIKGNPKFIEGNPKAEQFYSDLADHLKSLGYKVSFDAGEDFTEPPKANLWVGHSRGVGRLQFAPSETKIIAMGSDKEGAINHPDDAAFHADNLPTDAHYELSADMKEEIASRLREVKEAYDPSEPRDKHGKWIRGHGSYSDQFDELILSDPFNTDLRREHADHLQDTGNSYGATHLRRMADVLDDVGFEVELAVNTAEQQLDGVQHMARLDPDGIAREHYQQQGNFLLDNAEIEAKMYASVGAHEMPLVEWNCYEPGEKVATQQQMNAANGLAAYHAIKMASHHESFQIQHKEPRPSIFHEQKAAEMLGYTVRGFDHEDDSLILTFGKGKGSGLLGEAYDPSEARDKDGKWVAKDPVLNKLLAGKAVKFKHRELDAAKYDASDDSLRVSYKSNPGVWHVSHGVDVDQLRKFLANATPKKRKGLDSFLTGKAMKVRSSSLLAAKYDPNEQLLRIAYKSNPGVWHKFEQVDKAAAKDFHGARSKNTWVWDNLRVRGTRTEYKKPYTKEQPND